MKISAIISEYNPFHKGHLYQLHKTREITGCDAVVCIMSGNFVQRGEPAIIDKWSRTRMALENGIDLVLELPVIYSLSSAEFFAHGAVSILNSLGVIDNLCFGSEAGNIDVLYNIADILSKETKEYRNYLRKLVETGNPFHLSRVRALEAYAANFLPELKFGFSEVMSSSNNILGIEYCKSLIKNNSSIKPITIRREGGTYNSSEPDVRFSSATAIRRIIKESGTLDMLQKELPSPTFNTLQDLYSKHYPFVFSEQMMPYLKYRCLQNPEALEKLPDVKEGLENRIYRSIHSSKDYSSLILDIKSKRYTHTRINRILSQFFIGFDRYDTSSLRNTSSDYVRILGLNGQGAKVLKEVKKKSSLSIHTKLPRIPDERLQLDILSTQMYSLFNSTVSPFSDYLNSPIIFS